MLYKYIKEQRIEKNIVNNTSKENTKKNIFPNLMCFIRVTVKLILMIMLINQRYLESHKIRHITHIQKKTEKEVLDEEKISKIILFQKR